jgi:hypothetical protein
MYAPGPVQYGPEIQLGNFVAQTAAPTLLTQANKRWKDVPGGMFEETLIKLVGTGAGASSVSVTVWLWDGTRWIKPGTDPSRGLLNKGSAITDTAGLWYMETLYRLAAGQAIYMQATTPTNLTTLSASLYNRLR